MGQREELLTEVLRYVQKEYMQFVEIEKLTKELGDVLSADDRESVQLLLGMRQDAMNAVDEIRENIHIIVNAVEATEAGQLSVLLDCSVEFPAGETSFEAKKIRELSGQIKNSLDRIIAVDRVISKKLAGKDSYYSSLK